MEEEALWRSEPPAGRTAEEWVGAFYRLLDLIPTDWVDTEGDLAPDMTEEDELALFALSDAIVRCGLQAERQSPGIMKGRAMPGGDLGGLLG
jgi:hypothetical protein